LHKTLLDSERAVYERDVAKIQGPNHFLGLLMNDPWFAYLRELSGLIAYVDDILDGGETPATAEDAMQIVARAEGLLRPAENGAGFGKRYFEAIQRDPNVVLAHAAATREIAAIRRD
jgi:hypothetical protein